MLKASRADYEAKVRSDAKVYEAQLAEYLAREGKK